MLVKTATAVGSGHSSTHLYIGRCTLPNTADARAVDCPVLLPAACPCPLDRLDSGGRVTARGWALGAAPGVAGVRGMGVTSLADMPGALEAQLAPGVPLSPPLEASMSPASAALPGSCWSMDAAAGLFALEALALKPPADAVCLLYSAGMPPWLAKRCGWAVKPAWPGGWKREVTAAPVGHRGKRPPMLLYDSCASLSCMSKRANGSASSLSLAWVYNDDDTPDEVTASCGGVAPPGCSATGSSGRCPPGTAARPPACPVSPPALPERVHTTHVNALSLGVSLIDGCVTERTRWQC